MEIIVIWVGFSLLAGHVAGRKNRSAGLWFLLSLLLSPLLGLIAVLILPDLTPLPAADSPAAWTAPATAIAPPPAPDHLRTIGVLADLQDRGLITPAEYEAKKSDLLARV
jgi:hypothetical protein